MALELADVAAVGLDFVPKSFVHGDGEKNAVKLVSREGDFGFSPENGDPSAGHDVELVNFTSDDNRRAELSKFAFNCARADQGTIRTARRAAPATPTVAFTQMLRGDQPAGHDPLRARRRAYLVDYGAVRDPAAPTRVAVHATPRAAGADPGHRGGLEDLEGRLTHNPCTGQVLLLPVKPATKVAGFFFSLE